MDGNCSVAVIISKSSPTSDASSPAPVPGSPFEPQPHRVIAQGVPGSVQPKQVDESLIKVIEKLSKIVEQHPQRHCPSGGQKRGKHLDSSEVRLNPGSSPNKRMKNSCDDEAKADGSETDGSSFSLALGDSNNITPAPSEVAGGSGHIDLKRTVTCYQCSLCPYLSQTLAQLREHLKQHNEQHSDLILMCSECHFTSRDQEQLEAHVKLHFDDRGGTMRTSTEEEGVLKQGGEGERDSEARKGSPDKSSDPPKKKWYSYEEYGLYRCLICSYVCSQQRMLKTHAWKHAGLVDCSYPIFEEEEGGPARQETQAATNNIIPPEDLVILSPGLHDQNLQKLPAAIKLQLCVPVSTENQQDHCNPPVLHSSEGSETAPDEVEEKGYTNKDVSSEEPVVEVQVTTEGDGDMEVDGTQESSSIPDSLLSSAQKIINSSPNSAGHINVIVERLPSAEDTVMVTKPLLLNPDIDRDQGLLAVKEEEEQNPVGSGGCVDNSTNNPSVDGDCKSPLPKGDSSLRDENIPPTSRKRTHSESLRLHSLAAEALVAMPMRMPELPTSSPKVTLKSALPQFQNQRISDGTQSRQRASDVENTAALLDLELCQAKQEELGPLGLGEGDEEGPTTKAGISLSLLTVIERLRERSDQNTSDEDILKELQDNAQFQNGAVAAAITGNRTESYVCNIPGIDGLVGPADGGLVDYNPGSERPYRCRLCHYSSGNKGYIKQHLRVHRQRAPYQCPICEHKASDSKDLENHMIYHCKSRMHQCKYCPDAFHYKSQLRSHEREHHSCSSDTPSPTMGTDTITPMEESERGTDEEGGVPKMYKCDVCNYTSSTYVGVRNHRRIHNSDKPYRCCSCDFATTNMNSLKSHMRRHPQEHQAVQLLEQYRCSLCGYVCSHPPSLKSHMWKHAGDQNYNYEQVNKAINEAISQSSRPAGPPSPPPDSTQCPAQGKNPAASQGPPHTGPAMSGPPMEYCVLLFCCCICGFESTSKQRLMEHMKEHEGDIISIILNKEQQQEAEAQAGLQTAE
ncbi:zinc finger protein 507 [Poeciliopsis prolifica]|uniref:zinc finger protein 507 n=1 Tax=Poeciliopsis prolifica TaxID=188132 RepID=UPI002414080C|nr:zinc finger protein 507 [Poeciliopsis prolifica]